MDKSKEIIIIFEDRKAIVRIGSTEYGTVHYSINPCHARHYYLMFDFQNYEPNHAQQICAALRMKLNKPFQVMAYSDADALISFLSAAGFSCKRKCFEIDASVNEYTGQTTVHPLSVASAGSAVYMSCCKIMYERYIATHAAVSPWTGSPEAFISMLPGQVFYHSNGIEISNLAFVEENEIAYICGSTDRDFDLFAQALVAEILAQYNNVVFEADDCDAYAMRLKKLFLNQPSRSFNTYIL